MNSKTGRPEPGVAIQVLAGAGLGGNTDQDGRFSSLARGRASFATGVSCQESRVLFLFKSRGTTRQAQFLSRYLANTRSSLSQDRPSEELSEVNRGGQLQGPTLDVSLSSWGRARAGEPRIRVDLSHETKSDKEGRWRCDQVPGQLNNVLLVVTHPEYVAEGRPLVRSAHELAELRAQNHVTVLNEGVTVRGLVRDNDGHPIEGAQVSAPGSTIQRLTTTNVEGRFQLAHLEEGRNLLLIRAVGHAQVTEQIFAALDMVPVEIRLQAGRTVSGRVVDRRKKPVEGAQVWFDPGGFTQDNSDLHSSTDRQPPLMKRDAFGSISQMTQVL